MRAPRSSLDPFGTLTAVCPSSLPAQRCFSCHFPPPSLPRGFDPSSFTVLIPPLPCCPTHVALLFILPTHPNKRAHVQIRSDVNASIHAEIQKIEREMSNLEKVLTDRHLTRRELMEQRVSVLQVAW